MEIEKKRVSSSQNERNLGEGSEAARKWTRMNRGEGGVKTQESSANILFECPLSGCGFASSCSHNFRFCTCFKQEFLDIQATIECGLTLKRVRDMIITHSQLFNSCIYNIGCNVADTNTNTRSWLITDAW